MRIKRYPFTRRCVRRFTFIPKVINPDEVSWLEWIYVEETYECLPGFSYTWVEDCISTKERYLYFKERDKRWLKDMLGFGKEKKDGV